MRKKNFAKAHIHNSKTFLKVSKERSRPIWQVKQRWARRFDPPRVIFEKGHFNKFLLFDKFDSKSDNIEIFIYF